MQVETYEAVETTEKGVECDAEALALIEKLGLDGQKKLNVTGEGEGDPRRNPYRKLTAQEGFVYGQLLTGRSKLKDFSEGPIPLRVLQVASHAQPLFGYLEVWHSENADIKDPLLLGINGESWRPERFILARWGDVLEPLEKLVPIAMDIYRSHLKSQLSKFQGELAADLAFVQNMDLASMVTKAAPSYHGLR